MGKKSRSIAFSISVFFILLNVLSFSIIFYLTEAQYFKMAKQNIQKSNAMAAAAMQRNFDDVLSYMNDLTLKIYSDEALNGICSAIFREEYNGNSEKENMALQAEGICYDYLYYYGFLQSIGIYLENSDKTDIQLRKTHNPQLYNTLRAYREEIQEEVISNQGVIKCFDVGKEHQIVFARTLKDFKNVLREDQIIGTVMLTISPKYLTDALANTLVTPHGYAMLENKDGIISYSTKKADKGKYLEQTLPAGSEGQSWESLSVPIEALGQNLVIVTPREDISLTIGGFIKTLFLSVGILAMLNLILVLAISRMLTMPMEHLVKQIQKIGFTSLEDEHVAAAGYSEIENIADNFNRMLERIEHLVKENYLISLSEKNARIEALQSQINPHFIFNTLDTINWKVMFLDMPEVTNMISSLGNLLRYTTYQYGRYVSVEQEIDQVRNYLYIQEIRYDHSFRTYIKVERQSEKAVIPCLIIQPLIENAVVHGLKGKQEGVLAVRIRIRGEYLEIMVLDNGQGMEDSKIREVLNENQKGTGESIGLANVNQRLCLTYSLDQGMRITSRAGRYTRVEISIPLAGQSGTIIHDPRDSG
ncbi:sensor histidine kinase [Eubacterium sp. am_0171]|uniref:sensor histidine kinase n=1 Tax=unclassified Eubacterium (in: firmicutes) TaxID=2624479 RepID=UPI00101F6BF1|nr:MULTISPECIES: histidine kinase [unclassified Eubacterium (in: firmicutes)]MSC83912.1 HAMP domain-containing protein [Eubacterium sp. BIOML-A1]MSD07404.1 HAMP domain-containing protein [Eubacterium sp. BIOML-A2]RYT15229.1 sensor histidine kinase [Eubacterium sp. am_0171]